MGLVGPMKRPCFLQLDIVWFVLLLFGCSFLRLGCSLRVTQKFDLVDPAEFVMRFAGLGNDRFDQQVQLLTPLTPTTVEGLNLRKNGGVCNYSVSFPRFSTTSLLVFDDYKAWKALSTNSKTPCYQIMNQAKLNINLLSSRNVPDLSGDITYFNFVSAQNGSSNVKANGAIVWRKSKTWAILVLANCASSNACLSGSNGAQCQGSLVGNVEVDATNSSDFEGQFSLEDKGLFVCSLVLLIVQLLLFFGGLYTRALLIKLNKFHPTTRLLIWAIFSQLLSLFFATLYWLIVGSAGYKVQQLFILYSYLTAIANYFITIMLIFLGKGLTITRTSISPQGVLKIVAYATILFGCIIFAESFASFGFDSTTGLYLYASSSGILLLCLRCVVAFSWFIATGVNQMKTFQKKRRFFRKFLVLFGFWLIAPVPLVLISISLDPLSQNIFTFVWDNLLTMIAQCSLVIMYNPQLSIINNSFPFHRIRDVGDPAPIITSNVPTETASNGAAKPRPRKNIADLYADIRGNAIGISETVRRLSVIESKFSEVLDDWITDFAADEDDE